MHTIAPVAWTLSLAAVAFGQARPSYVPPKITKYADRVAVYYDVNLTAVGMPNPWWEGWSVPDAKAAPDRFGNPQWAWQNDCYDYAKALKLTPAAVFYNGTFSRVGTYAADDGTFRPRDQLDWSREKDALVPLDAWRAGTLAKLAIKADTYVEGMPPQRPVFIDIESADGYVMNAWWLPGDQADALKAKFGFAGDARGIFACPLQPDQQREAVHAGKIATIKNWIRLLDAVRGTLGPDRSLYVYGAHYWLTGDAGMQAGETIEQWKARREELLFWDREMSRRLSGFCCPLYTWDFPTSAPDTWFRQAEGVESIVEQFYPQWRSNKVAFLNPVYQVYWKRGDPWDAKDGQPVDLDFWRQQLKWCRDHRYNIFVWTGNTKINLVKRHLEEAAKYAR